MTRRIVIYPFLLGIYPVIYLYAKNSLEVTPDQIVSPLLVILAGSAALWLVLRLALRDAHRAGLLVALAATYLAIAPGAAPFLEVLIFRLSCLWVAHWYNIPRDSVMIPLGAIFLVLALITARWLKRPERLTQGLNVFAAILVSLASYQAWQGYAARSRQPDPRFPTLAALRSTEHRPDIYYIILDGFARADILRERFDVEIEPYLAHLEARGFYVAREATTNYCQTPLSLSCSLNSAHLEDRASSPEAEIPPDPRLFRDNAVVRSLRPLGYRFITFASGFDFTDGPYSDIHLSPYPYTTSFQRMLLEPSPFARFLPNPNERDSYTMTRERTEFLFDTLPKIARRPGPTFTFAHVLSPHPPFVFGESGEDVSPHWKPYFLNDGDVYSQYYGKNDSYRVGYRGQAAYLIKRACESIDAILANSTEPPIIILQSDHGSGMHLDTGDASRNDHRERMSILNAIYLPGGGRKGLHPGISPVNAFRVVFNNEFGADLPLLPDESYYSSWGLPFQFIRVTDQVATSRPRASAPKEGEEAAGAGRSPLGDRPPDAYNDGHAENDRRPPDRPRQPPRAGE